MSDPTHLPDEVSDAELAEALRVVRRTRARQEAGQEATIFLRGEGGAVFEMAPSRMSPDTKRRLRMGRLRRVNPDGSPYRTHTREPAPETSGAGGSALTQGRVPRPAKSAPKKDWVLYAVAALGVDAEQAEGMTRQDLIDLPEDHGQHDEPVPEDDTPPAARTAGRPQASAPKAEWIAHVVSLGQVSAEDAANFTKADLIDMSS